MASLWRRIYARDLSESLIIIAIDPAGLIYPIYDIASCGYMDKGLLGNDSIYHLKKSSFCRCVETLTNNCTSGTGFGIFSCCMRSKTIRSGSKNDTLKL